MLKGLFGGPEFVVRALSVCGLTSVFLLEHCKPIIQQINEIPNAEVVAIITDGHRINQKFFDYLRKNGDTYFIGEPWKGPNNTILLYDYVHLMKCVRNNWISEKCGQLKFEYDGKVYTSSWDHLKQLYNSESENLLRLSKLFYEAVHRSLSKDKKFLHV